MNLSKENSFEEQGLLDSDDGDGSVLVPIGDLAAVNNSGSGVPSSAPQNKNAGRQIRWVKEHQNLHNIVSTLLRANASLINCGVDPMIEILAERLNFGRSDLVILRTLFGPRSFTVVAAPKRIWRDKGTRNDLLNLKRMALSQGTRVMLVNGSSLQYSSRYEIARALASARAVRPTRGERLKIVGHVVSQKESSLAECVALVPKHPDPVGLVLHLCATRWLRLKSFGHPSSSSTKIVPVS